jgi:hypothetical protein
MHVSLAHTYVNPAGFIAANQGSTQGAREGPLAQPWTRLTEALANFALSQDWRLKP